MASQASSKQGVVDLRHPRRVEAHNVNLCITNPHYEPSLFISATRVELIKVSGIDNDRYFKPDILYPTKFRILTDHDDGNKICG